jgi:hypothetical protein
MNKEELKNLLTIFVDRFGCKPVSKSIFNTWLCGHCHTYPRRANDLIEDMQFYYIIRIKKGVVEF